MLNKIETFLAHYRDAIAYIVVGGLATMINTFFYFVLFDVLKWSNVASSIIAWFIAVVFAFILNKTSVFRSKSWQVAVVIQEAGKFFGYRALTGILDIGFMWLTVDKFLWNGLLMKIISNVIVTVINYYASKYVIFRNRKE